LPLEITNLESAPEKPELISSEEKAKRALQRTIEKKKAEQKSKDDESQTTLF
jgi:topoisomerase-4 subunit A